MSQTILVFFQGCPRANRARKLLNGLSIPFVEACQNAMKIDDPLLQYSSPTILCNGEIVLGSQTSSPACSLDGEGDWQRATLLLKELASV